MLCTARTLTLVLPLPLTLTLNPTLTLTLTLALALALTLALTQVPLAPLGQARDRAGLRRAVRRAGLNFGELQRHTRGYFDAVGKWALKSLVVGWLRPTTTIFNGSNSYLSSSSQR